MHTMVNRITLNSSSIPKEEETSLLLELLGSMKTFGNIPRQPRSQLFSSLFRSKTSRSNM